MLCPVRLVSCDLRDGQQAAIATRMTTEEMLPVLKPLDEFGFDAWKSGAVRPLTRASAFWEKILGASAHNQGSCEEDAPAYASAGTESFGLCSLPG